MKKRRSFIPPLFVILIVAFFAIYLKEINYSVFSDIRVSLWPLFLATLISLGFRYWSVIIWRFILIDLGATEVPRFSTLTQVYSKAWMARYIPGTVTWIAGKIYMASKLGISKSHLAVSSLLEAGVQIVATLSLSLAILALDPRLDVISGEVKIGLIALAVVSLVTLLPPVLNRLLERAVRLIRRQTGCAELRSNGKATIRSFLLYTIGAILVGNSYYFLTVSLHPNIGLEYYWYIVGTFTLSGALGMAIPFVPSGLGVRDGAQLVLLSLIMPKEIALAITVFSRLWSAAVDVLFFLLSNTPRLFGGKQRD